MIKKIANFSQILSFFLFLNFYGCATIHPVVTETETGNKNITVENLIKIRKGKSTKEEIKDVFGEPNKTAANTPDQSTTWTYLHTQTRQNNNERAPFQIDQTQLDIVFNKDGIVTEYIQTISNRLKKN